MNIDIIFENGEAATPTSTTGMGNVVPPSTENGGIGSGDTFNSLDGGGYFISFDEYMKKKKKKKKKKFDDEDDEDDEEIIN